MFGAIWQLWISTIAMVVVWGSPVQIRSPYVVKDSHSLPKKWQKLGPAPKDHVITLQIGLKQIRFHELEKLLYEGMSILLNNDCHFTYYLPYSQKILTYSINSLRSIPF